MQNKKCVVIGANGYIGKHLVRQLLRLGADVRSYGSKVCDGQTGIVDIGDVNSVAAINFDVDYVFLFAGRTGTSISFDEYDSFVRVNELGVLNVLNAIRSSQFRPQVIFPSTRLVYKGGEGALSEDSIKEAKTVYAVNKIAAENYLAAYQNSFGIPYTIYRVGVPYGNLMGGGYSYGTIGAFLKQSLSNGVIKLYGDGELRRTFTHVDDICMQIIVSCQSQDSVNEVFNVHGENFSLLEIASHISAMNRSRVELVPWPEKDLRIESGSTAFDSRKLTKLLNMPLRYYLREWVGEQMHIGLVK